MLWRWASLYMPECVDVIPTLGYMLESGNVILTLGYMLESGNVIFTLGYMLNGTPEGQLFVLLNIPNALRQCGGWFVRIG